MSNQGEIEFKSEKNTGPVECLGQIFESDEARREHYLTLLAEKLKDPEFRKTPGFPQGTDEAILCMSDPPYYTACPNPFLQEFVRVHGRQYDPDEKYDREPFAVDVSEGKYDALYRAHPYHTKVPHLAIVPSILHYTNPGDIVLDGFCGSGMTGVAAQWCGAAPTVYKRELEMQRQADGLSAPIWGSRRVVLGDLAPAATFIAAGFNLPMHFDSIESQTRFVIDAVKSECGWMYQTLHSDGLTKGWIDYTVWSEVFSCPNCAGEVVFVEEALDKGTKRTQDEFPCPSCGASVSKKNLERLFETLSDPVTGTPWKRIKLTPALIAYSVGSRSYEKKPDEEDFQTLARIDSLPFPAEVPSNPLPIDEMYHGSRLEPKGFTNVHHLFLTRSAHVLAACWRRSLTLGSHAQRRMMGFLIEQIITTGSVMNRYRPASSFGNGPLRGVYYVSSQIAEASILELMEGILKRFRRGFEQQSPATPNHAAIHTGDCASLSGLPDSSIDYVFTDPPFGANIFYADLNFLVESWHKVLTDAAPEAIVDSAKHKSTVDYQDLMRRCFEEYHRVLKPGRWMTVVFSNSKNHIWRAIQEAMGTAGFVVADVRTLDKKQGSYRQVTSSAVKQDLVISAYKPSEALSEQFKLGTAGVDGVWSFISEHLHHVPVFVGKSGKADVVAERTPQMLHDRMIAFFVQRGVGVPISGPEFLAGLLERYPERDGMHFLQGQVSEYDRKRTTVGELHQLTLFVSDEASATQWIRQQLQAKPQSFQDLQPQFMQQLQSWSKHEKTIELNEILELNFLCYDGTGPVPSQIKSYLSTNFKDMRNLENDDPRLQAKAKDRWYVPNPNKEGDIEKQRLKTLLKEFEEYRTSTSRKIKQFRTEAVRAGFKHCYDQGDYATIIAVTAKLPEIVIQEDEKLLMYYDVATMRLGD